MVRYYWLSRIEKAFKWPRKEWSNNDIRKGCLSSLNKYIDVSTPSSSQLNANSTINFSDIKKADRSIKNSISTDEFFPTQLLNKFTKCRNSIRVRIPINKVKVGDIGYRFEKNFKGFGIFEGCVVVIKTHTENNKNRRCVYTDGDSEDLSFIQLRSLKILSPKFLSPIKLLKCAKSLKEHETISSKLVEVEQVKVRIPINIVKVGDVGYRFRKNFKGYGIFEGCVIEIKTHAENNKNRRCLYTDGDSEDLSLIQIRSYKRLTSKYLSPC